MADNPFLQSIRRFRPGLFEALHGSAGSGQVMGEGIFRGMQQQHQFGNMGVNPGFTNMMTSFAFQHLFSQGDASKTHGIGAGQMGAMFEEMSRRGMDVGLGGGQHGAPNFLGFVSRMQQMTAPVSAARDIFANMGQMNVSTPQMFEMINTLTQGGLHTMRPGQMEGLMRRSANLAQQTGMGMPAMSNLITQSANLAESVGLDRQLGVQTAQQGAAFGMAFGNRAGPRGFGGLSRDQATALDVRLRTAAAKSPMANMMGSAMAMAQAGILGDVGEQLLHDPEKRKDIISEISEMNPGEFINWAKDSGVSGSTAMQFLQAKGANQEQIAEFGLQNRVRVAQGKEIKGMMQNQLTAGMAGFLRGQGMSAAERRQVMPGIANKITEELARMQKDEPGLITDPRRMAERNKKIAEVIQADLGLEEKDTRMLVAGAVRSLEGGIRRDPNLKQFGNLAGMLGMTAIERRGGEGPDRFVGVGADILRQGGQEVMEADRRGQAQKDNAAKGQGGFISRLSDAIQKFKKGEGVGKFIGKVLGALPEGVLEEFEKRTKDGEERAEMPVGGRGPDGQNNDMVASGGRGGGGLTINGRLILEANGVVEFQDATGVAA